MTREYYTPAEAAGHVNYSAGTIRDMARDGQIPGARKLGNFGRKWLIPATWVHGQRP